MKYPITLDALQVLDAIARKGSFAGAANELYRVPSAVSYTIQKLEQDLELVLFRKQGRKAVLTEAGKVLLEQGRDILEAAGRMTVAAKTAHSGWEPVFTIAIDSVLSFDFIYPLLAKFYELQPDIEINLYEEVLGGTLDAVVSGRADLAIGAGAALSSDSSLCTHPIGMIEWLFAVAPGHELAKAPLPLTMDLIAQQRFVVARDSSRNQAPQSRRVLSKRPVLSVPSLDAKIQAQCLGLGVGFLPAHQIKEQLAQGVLLALPTENTDASDPVHIAWKTANKGKVLAWFKEALQKTMPINP